MRRVAIALVALAASAGGALAQGSACQFARDDLAALDQGGGAVAMQRRAADFDRLVDYYYAAGCAAPSSPFWQSRPPQCGQLQARIARMEAGLSRPERGGPDPRRRAQLAAAVARACGGDSALSASSRAFDNPDAGSSRLIIDENDQIRSAPSGSQPLGRAMCVRSCDGFYFPLATSPGGRDGADEMCQALCPASPTRAFFVDSGSVDNATNGDGARYASTPNAYKFRRQISQSCSCKPPAQSWSAALQRAEELAGPGAGDAIVNEGDDQQAIATPLRPGAGPDRTPPRGGAKRLQPIDPEPLDDGPLEPEFLPPEPSGVAVMTPVKPKEPVSAPPAASPSVDRSTARTDEPKKPVRTVGPPIKYESGPPLPIQSRPEAVRER